MPTRKLTAQTVHALKAQSTRVDYFDAITPGFGIRITPTSVKTWFFMYRVNGTRLRRWTIGRYPTLSLADAREKDADRGGRSRQARTDPAADESL